MAKAQKNIFIFLAKHLRLFSGYACFSKNNFDNLNYITMKNVVKRPLKVIAAAAFMVALGYGIATNSEVSELSSFVNLSALSGVSAQGEIENDRWIYCQDTSTGCEDMLGNSWPEDERRTTSTCN